VRGDRRLLALPWLAAGLALLFGVAWRDCVLVACSAWLAVHAFYARMDADAPWDGWRAALRCWLAGVGMLLAAIMLLLMVASAQLGWWSASADVDAELTVLLLAAGIAAFGRLGRPIAPSYAAALGLAAVAAVTALLLADEGLVFARCVFAGASAVAVASMGWRLARHVAPELAASDERW